MDIYANGKYPRKVSSTGTGRRGVLKLGGTATVALLAGCLGDGSAEEIDQLTEQSLQQFDEVGTQVDAAFQQSDAQEWNGCLTELEGVPGQIESARQDAQEALELAETDGHSDYADTLTLLVELLDLMDEIVAELTMVCEAGTEEDHDQIESRSQNIQELSQEFDQTEQEFQQSLEALEE